MLLAAKRGFLAVIAVALGVCAAPTAAEYRPAPPTPAQSRVRADAATTALRPVLEQQQGRYFRWSAPPGWRASETISGVDLVSPDGQSLASSALLMRSQGSSNPRDFIVNMLQRLPGYTDLRVLSMRNLPDQASGIPGTTWKVAQAEVSYRYRGVPARASWTSGVSNLYGYVYNAFMLGYQTPAARFDQDRLWLWEVARSVTVTNPRAVAGNDSIVLPRNNPLDNSGLIESWRQKGLSEDRIAKAQREATMGYERVKDAQTGRIYDMPLERYDGTVGGYRNPMRPTEILQRTQPSE